MIGGGIGLAPGYLDRVRAALAGLDPDLAAPPRRRGARRARPGVIGAAALASDHATTNPQGDRTMTLLTRALPALPASRCSPRPPPPRSPCVGWPGGPEEAALRAVTEIYNAKPDVADEDKVELIFFSRDGFWDKLQADLAAGSDAFDANLLATYSIGRYAPFMEPIDAVARGRGGVRRRRCCRRCSSTASNTACRPTSRCISSTTAPT